MTEVERAVTQFLESHEAQRLYIGFSGGVDSTALLLAVHQCNQRQHRRPLTALHFDHALRDSSQANRACVSSCQEICAQLQIPLIVGRGDDDLRTLPGNLEASARNARYDFFRQHVGRDDVLLLAHHSDDQLETELLRLFQGRGLMHMVPHATRDGLSIARPLLMLSATQLVDFAVASDVTWIEDPSNADTSFDRNYLRHEIVPRLRARWRGLAQHVDRVAQYQESSAAALRHALGELGDVVAWSSIAPDAPVAWLRAYLAHRGVFTVSDRALLDFFVQGANGVAQLDLGVIKPLSASVKVAHAAGMAVSLRAYAARLYFSRQVHMAPSRQVLDGTTPQSIEVGGGVFTLNAAMDGHPFNLGLEETTLFLAPGELVLKTRRGGERIQCLEHGRSRSVKQLLAEAGVPPWRRAHYPLLWCGEDIVCIPGIAVASSGRLNSTDVLPEGALAASWQVSL